MSRALWLWTLLLCAARAESLVILQYHHVSDDTPPITSTSPALFNRHLEMIDESGFSVIDLAALTTLIRSGAPLPDKSVLITFDDSYRSIYTTAFPLLKARGWPFVIFANTEPVDAGRAGFLSWSELREMGEAGAAIANHTVGHPHLARRPDTRTAEDWQARIRAEITDAEASIRRHTGQSHRVLAFPYGEYEHNLQTLLEEMGYLGMSQSSGAATSGQALALPRFPMGGRYGQPADFALKLRALPMPTQAIRVLDDSGDLLTPPLLPATITQPVLELQLRDRALNASVQCYASGQDSALEKSVPGDWLRFQTTQPLPAGRSRYNCTARQAESGRYHWLSIPFLRPTPEGSWPPEP